MKANNKILLLLGVCIIFQSKLIAQCSLKNVPIDKYTQPVLDSNTNNKITYQYLPINNTRTLQNHVLSKGVDINETDCSNFWKAGIMGSCIGDKSFCFIDLDNDGKQEIVCSAEVEFRSSFWYIMQYDSVKKEYIQTWLSSMYNDDKIITRIAAYKDNLGAAKFFVGLDDGTIDVYNGISPIKISTIATELDEIKMMAYADANNDGIKELVISDDDNLLLLDYSSYNVLGKLFQGGNFAIGNVDEDDKNEIVFASGIVITLTGTNINPKWNFDENGSANDFISIGNIDNDSINEIIRAKIWYTISVYDAKLKTRQYEIKASLDIDALLIKDLNNDGKCEIVYGNRQEGKIHFCNGINGKEMWEITSIHTGVTDFLIEDTDGDGKLEIVWGAGCYGSGADYLYVYEIESKKVEWLSQDLTGPFTAITVGDADNDGVNDILTISSESESGRRDGILSTFNLDTHQLTYRYKNPEQKQGIFEGNAWTGIHDVVLADVDNDKKNEIIVATSDIYDGALFILNKEADSLIVKAKYTNDNYGVFYCVDVADLDNDGKLEIITGDENGVVRVFDAETGFLKWESEELGIVVNDLKIANLDNDVAKEIIVACGSICIIDGVTYQQTQTNRKNFTAIDLYDYDKNGMLYIVAGSANGEIVAYNPDSLNNAKYKYYSNIFEKINGLVVTKVNNSTSPYYFYTTNDKFYCSDGIDKVKTLDENFGGYLGQNNSLVPLFDEENNLIEIIAGSSAYVSSLSSSCINSFVDFTTATSSLSMPLSIPFTIYPNPGEGNTIYLSKTANIKLYNMMGRLIYEQENCNQFTTENLSSGLYILKTEKGETAKLIIK